jgi:hypothetical protein
VISLGRYIALVSIAVSSEGTRTRKSPGERIEKRTRSSKAGIEHNTMTVSRRFFKAAYSRIKTIITA